VIFIALVEDNGHFAVCARQKPLTRICGRAILRAAIGSVVSLATMRQPVDREAGQWAGFLRYGAVDGQAGSLDGVRNVGFQTDIRQN
jgi:hypothetical protein